MWLIGGNPDDNDQYGDKCIDYHCQDVWKSQDGENWTFVGNGSFGQRRNMTAVTINNSLYVMGGLKEETKMNDTWKTSDGGLTWTLVLANGGWEERMYHTSVVFNNNIWIIGGKSDELENSGNKNDVW